MSSGSEAATIFRGSILVGGWESPVVSEKKPEVIYFPAVRRFCPVCGKVAYSLSGEHPQCAMKRADAVARTKKQLNYRGRAALIVK